MIYIRNTAVSHRGFTCEIALGTNIGFVTSASLAKYCRNRIGNEHRGCKSVIYMQNTVEIGLGTNIGFATIDLHTKYCRNRIGIEHRICNH